MKISHLDRYAAVARLFVKYGRADMVDRARIEPELAEPAQSEAPDDAAQGLARDLERLGPTFVKLGQLLSSRPQLLPREYREALARLQDDVEPVPLCDIHRVLEHALSLRVEDAFATFDPEPLAAASIGQVHRATLEDGREVVVKVQRPGIREQVREDLAALEDIAEFMDRHTELGRSVGFARILAEFRESYVREFDYTTEARNLERLGAAVRKQERILVPVPVPERSARRVLTMSYVEGVGVADLHELPGGEKWGEELADELVAAYLTQILEVGTYHADPHPGNVIVTRRGQLALIDLGMVAHLSHTEQDELIALLSRFGDGRGDLVAEQLLEASLPGSDCDRPGFLRRVFQTIAWHDPDDVENLNIGAVLLDLANVAADHGYRPPPYLPMLGKAMLQLEEIVCRLAPTFSVRQALERHLPAIARRRTRAPSLEERVQEGLEAARSVARIPQRIDTVLAKLVQDDLRVQVDAIDEAQLILGLQKIANRIAAGLVLAALIVAAALMMNVSTEFELFGYPGIALVCFALASAGGAHLLWSIWWQDRSAGSATAPPVR